MQKETKSDTALYGWRVVQGPKDVKSFVKFSVSKSTKDKKTQNWNTMYIDVLCGDRLASLAQRVALEGTNVYVKGNLMIGQYKDKLQFTLFANELEPITKDTFDKSIEKIGDSKLQTDDLPW